MTSAGSSWAAAGVALVACAHGTADPEGQKAVEQLRARIADLLPGVDVLEASVDVQEPSLDDVVAGLVAQGRRCVVVPLLLSAGYHVFHDIARTIAAAGGAARAGGALGPDDALVALLDRRLREAGVAPDAPVVLGAAGSSDARAVRDVEQVAARLAELRGAPVTPGYLSAAEPRVEAVVAQLVAGSAAGAGGTGAAVATYLLAPGYFYDRLLALRGPGTAPGSGAGASVVSAPLAPDDAIAAIAVRRYTDALATWQAQRDDGSL